MDMIGGANQPYGSKKIEDMMPPPVNDLVPGVGGGTPKTPPVSFDTSGGSGFQSNFGTTPANPALKSSDTVPGFNPKPAATITPSTVGSNGFGQPYQNTSPNLSLLDQQTQWNPTTGNVSDDERVSQQLTKLLSENSPYVDQARQRAMQRANERGLANSTLAAGAGEEAAIAQALPIAQQDASTYLNQATRNQAASNAAGSQNAQTGFSLKQLGEQARQFDNDSSLKTQSLVEQARQYDTTTGEQQRQFDNDQALKNRTLTEQQRQFDNDQISKLSMFNRETGSREQLAQLDSATKQYLAKTEAQYKNQLQTSASAAQMWQTYQQEVTRILNSKDLDQPNKQAALDILGRNLKEGMSVIGYVGSLNLTNLLTFTGSGGGALPPAPAPAAPAPDIGQPAPSTGSPLPPAQAANPNQNPGPDYQWDGRQWTPRFYPQGDGA